MSDPDRNPQYRRGNIWPTEEPKKPPPDDARQRRPEVQQGAAPVTNKKLEDGLNIAPRHDSRTADKLLGTQKHTGGACRSKTVRQHKRKQPNFERVVKIARRFLDPRRMRP